MPKKRPRTIYLEVVVKKIYGFEEKQINGWDTNQVISDWFGTCDINSFHATRDGHHYGNMDTITSIRETTPEEFEPEVKAYFQRIGEAKKKEKEKYEAFLRGEDYAHT